MDKPTLTYDQQALISRMTEAAGELLFEATRAQSFGSLLALAETLGQLYGEAIRQCKDHDGLHGEVTTTFMCGMAVRPNFGREEEPVKSSGELLYEKAAPDPILIPWNVLCMRDREAWENEAMTRAEGKEREMEREAKGLAVAHGLQQLKRLPADKRKALLEGSWKGPCLKCNGSGNMSLLGAYEKCDAC